MTSHREEQHEGELDRDGAPLTPSSSHHEASRPTSSEPRLRQSPRSGPAVGC